jgi:hypothetical protein
VLREQRGESPEEPAPAGDDAEGGRPHREGGGRPRGGRGRGPGGGRGGDGPDRRR